MNIEQFRKAGYQAIDRICDYYYSIEKRPLVSQVKPGYLREALPSSAPLKGEDFQTIADDYQKFIIPGISPWQHPSFFAFFPAASTFESMLGELYASSLPSPGFNWACSPAATELEAVVMDWAAQLLGLESHFHNSSTVGGGVIQPSASEAGLVAVIAARSKYTRKHPDVKQEDLIIYTTSQTHSLGLKAGLILGLTCRALDVHPEDQYGLRGTTLRDALEEDRKQGKHPFIIVATIGTTSSGAIDRLNEISEVAKDHPYLWIHVDAAWAGVTLACPEYRERCMLKTINESADSFCTNFHKWGLVGLDLSALWVRNRKDLTDALDITPEYLRSKHSEEGTVIDYRNWQLGLGRRFRSLKLWFVLRGHGVEGFQRAIRNAIEVNNYFAELVRDSPLFHFVTEPSFALTVFRIVPSETGESETALLNTLNQAFFARLSARSDIWLTQTVINGVFCIRLAVGTTSSTKEHIDMAWEILNEEAATALVDWRRNQVALGVRYIARM